MAVHLPLGPAAILEAQLLMLASHNILNPANGSPITVPSQDMVLGLYYMTKPMKNTKEMPVRGEGMIFYSPEEVEIALNEGAVDLHALIKIKGRVEKEDGTMAMEFIDTTVGRVLFNQAVPEKVAFINEILTKKALRGIIANVLKKTDVPATAKFLDDIKSMGYGRAFRGGLSFSLNDIRIPDAKATLISEASEEVEGIFASYNMGLITNNERYNQVIDVWTNTNARLTQAAMSTLINDRQGFNPIYMMLDSGARGSKEQIRQLSGMRGLMAKPQKSGSAGGEIIENPIISNFKEGLSILEYFISTHGARKGLADTALKTADAGYLTRRLHDVAQDVVVNEVDCGTLRGLEVSALKKSEEVVETLSERIIGRVSLSDVIDPLTDEVYVASGEEITEEIANKIEASPIEIVEVRSPLTCGTKKGICAKCYGTNLATSKMAQAGDSVGVIAAQSIGEPGTQLTLRTFHVGGTAGNVSEENKVLAKFDGKVELEDVRTVEGDNGDTIVIGRTGEMRIVDTKTGRTLMTNMIPYGGILKVKDGAKVKKGAEIVQWDPYNAVIISEMPGKIGYQDIIQGTTYKVEIDEQTGFQDKVISENRNRKLVPTIQVLDAKGNEVKHYTLPVVHI